MVDLISTSDREWRCLSFEINCCAILVKELHVNTKIWFYRVSNPQVKRQNLEILNLQMGKAVRSGRGGGGVGESWDNSKTSSRDYGCNRSLVSHFKAGTVNITSNLLCRFCHVHKCIEDRNALNKNLYYYYYLLLLLFVGSDLEMKYLGLF